MNLNISITEFNSFSLLPKPTNREEYNNISNNLKNSILSRGDFYLRFTPPQIFATDYLSYTREGDRTKFESLYFERRSALSSLVLAECFEYEGKYIDKIVDLVILICEESGWQLPAHNNYIRDTTPLPFPDTKRPVLDLFALETSAILATTLFLLSDKFDGIFSFVIDRVYEEIENRIIKPYLTYDFWWMGKDEPTLNWTVWCTQNMLLTTFMLDFEDTIKHDVSKIALGSLQSFLNDYGADGCCDEGALYFRRAGLCFFASINILNNVTNDKFDFVYKDDKVKNIANYIKNVHVKDQYYINFADCSAVCDYSGAREYLFAKAIKDENLMNFAAKQHREIVEIDLPLEVNIFDKLLSIFTNNEINEFNVDEKIIYEDLYYKSVGLFIARDTNFCLAVKAGHNYDNHNHNDTGSFTLFKNGLPFIIDVGVESYSAKTFSPKRYEIWTMQSSYHNLPDFDNVMQMDGKDFKATDVKTVFDEDYSIISMELKNAYPPSAKIDSFNREITFNKNKEITLIDKTSGEYKESVLNLMLWKKPVFKDNTIVSEIGTIEIYGNDSVTIEEIKVLDPRIKIAWEDFVYRVRISYSKEIRLIFK